MLKLCWELSHDAYCNLTIFTVAKVLWRLVRIWRRYGHESVVLGHRVDALLELEAKKDSQRRGRKARRQWRH